MAFSRDQERPSRRGHGVGHNALQESYINYGQDPMLDGSDDSGLLMGRQGFTEERFVDPRTPAWNQASSGDTGLPQDYDNFDHPQQGHAMSGYPQSSGTDFSYLNSTYLNSSGNDLGMRA